jgi:spore germination protein YaaH
MEAVIEFVTKDVAASKISLGIPFYSCRWYPSFQNNQAYAWGHTLDYETAKGLAERYLAQWKWDEREKVNYTMIVAAASVIGQLAFCSMAAYAFVDFRRDRANAPDNEET